MARPQTSQDNALFERYEPVIGLEVHAHLLTATKIFCACRNRFGDAPNTNVCPVCLGLPGALPVLSRHAVTLAMRAARATHCRIEAVSIFERKNYFYPDLPKGYQISQYARPLAVEGRIDIAVDGATRRVRLHRIHMEEDAGKLLHEGFAWSHDKSGVDLNRSGVPLIEIVTYPDIHSPAEAYAYLTALKAILLYTEVSDCNMEEGSLRCDANVSVMPRGSATFGTRAEIKNLNSFRNVERALAYEIQRQALLLESGGAVVQETRLFDADRGETVAMRSKEEAHDYRYFPEPDLPPVRVDADWIAEVQASLPELPQDKRERFAAEYALPAYDIEVLTQTRATADYFEAVAKVSGNAKAASNWVMTEILRKLKDDERPLSECRVRPEQLAELIALIDQGTISGKIAKDVFEKMWASGAAPRSIVESEGLLQVSDEGAIQRIVDEIVAANPDQVKSYRGGKASAIGWFVGQVMRKMQGKANPQLVNALLKKTLDQ
ncbi:MAG: Asp-tRNA(Asn)/Glu-tRNA(Gln) amidotransferase subunit GatB [Vicinamibacteria bacterium]|nr:Asp-tRNA(Asn)/Glu-tRNA(Gln) amidotransferase subunit GatB [Vicinamibacteria bacterium]